MTMHRMKFVFVGLIALLVFAGTLGAEQFKPLPPNNDLLNVFDSIKVPSPDIQTRIRYLWENDKAWYTRWKMLEMAKESIDCTYFIVDKDIFGQAFLGHLAKKAREGVKVRLMIDGRIYRSPYMKGMADRCQELAALPNVQIRLYNSISKDLLHIFTDFMAVFSNNHDKIIISDKKTTITGGRNIGSDYFAGRGEEACVYRDSDVVMDGPGVTLQMQQAFEVEWNHLRNSNVSPDLINWKSQSLRLNLAYHVMNKYLTGGGLFDPAKAQDKESAELIKEFNAEISLYKNLTSYASFDLWQGERRKPVKIIDKSAKIGSFNDITPTLSRFMDACKHEIFVQSPYVVLTDEAYAALKRASERGVKIVIHSNSGGSTDSLFPQAFLMNDWKKMLKEMPTLRLMVAPTANERLHSKCFVFDSQIAVVGTYNMDPLSQEFNSEVVAAVKDPAFGTMIRHRLYEDMQTVVEYKIQIQPDGTVKGLVGPEDHLNSELVKKMNMYRKLWFLRPVI